MSNGNMFIQKRKAKIEELIKWNNTGLSSGRVLEYRATIALCDFDILISIFIMISALV